MNKKISIGYDLGGQGCGIGLFDVESGNLIDSGASKLSNLTSADEIFENICKDTESLLEKNAISVDELVSMCMATAGTLGPKGAIEPIEIDHILISPNISCLNGFSFRKAFTKRFPSVLFLMENDANAAGWAEWFYGIGKRDDVRTLVGFTLGSGLGGSIIIDGVMIRPAELGHVIIDSAPSAPTCGCGTRGCAEAYISIAGFKRIAKQLMLETPKSRLWKLFKEDNLDPLPIAQLAREGDSAALLVYSKIGYYLGRLIWNIKRVCAPDAVSFSGNIARSLDLMLPSMKMVLSEDPLIEGQLILQATSLGEGEAGIYGAGGLAIQAYEQSTLN